MRCGLLGERLGHSFSPEIHRAFGRYDYDLISLSREEIPYFIRQKVKKEGIYRGFNVTIPYKKMMMDYCDRLSEEAVEIGSINTVVRDQTGKLRGYNTDACGFRYLLETSPMDVRGKKILVLGSGGTSATARHVLYQAGAGTVDVVSRRGKIDYDNADREAEMIVNTTPVGMYPGNGECLIHLEEYGACEGIVDVVFNPLRTELLLRAEELGIPAVNGLGMLVAQAKKSCEYFTEEGLDDGLIDDVCRRIRGASENIILIGMPGCGKSHVGALISRMTGRRLLDVDSLIERDFQCRIRDVFEHQGEAAFREMESEVAARVGKETGVVISTGGGTILKKENVRCLRQNGVLYFLEREVDQLPVRGKRPLSEGREALARMYEKRFPLYSQCCDYFVKNDRAPREAAEAILRIHERRTYENTGD